MTAERPEYPSPAARPVTIEQAEVFVLSAPISPPAGVSIGLATAHEYVLVRLSDQDGRVGWGETYLLPGIAATMEALAAQLIGMDPGAFVLLRRELAVTRASTYAQSALLIAVDDLRARQLGVPVHRLYGGPTRSRVPAYAASQGYVAGVALEHTWLAEVAEFVERGFTAFKLRVGRCAVEREIEALESVRVAVPATTGLMVDGNGGYTVETALRMGRALAALGALWFEEPLPQDGYHGYADLRARLDVPIAGGEIIEQVADAQRFVGARTFDILQPEPVICGGIDGALRIAAVAALSGVPVIPHTSGSAVGIAAALQVLACLEDPTRSPACPPLLLELGTGPNPWRTELLTVPLELDGEGAIPVPSGPGLGVEVDEAFVRRNAVGYSRCC